MKLITFANLTIWGEYVLSSYNQLFSTTKRSIDHHLPNESNH